MTEPFPEKLKGMRHDTYMRCSGSTTRPSGNILPA